MNSCVTDRLHPYPSAWYALGFSKDLPAGGVWNRTFCGEDVVVFRTESGAISVAQAYCPHLGAHLGKGGVVRGEALECPFHAFRFDREGACVHVPYGTKPPPLAVLKTWPTAEADGLVLVWHGIAGEGPTFAPPSHPTEGWSEIMGHEFFIRSHPQETTENSVDLGHLSVVHGYRDVAMLEALETRGAYLSAKYGMTRDNPFLPFMGDIRSEFRVHVHGLGVSVVDVEVLKLGFRFRFYVLSQPEDGEKIRLRIGVRMHQDHPLSRGLPLVGGLVDALIRPLIQRATLAGLRHDVSQDFAIWEHKVYVAPPILAKGDGPVGPYRSWCKQFYRSPG